MSAEIAVTRCETGRLADAYPVSRHDVELQVSGVPTAQLSAVLARESDRILSADPQCRKVVFAAPIGDVQVMAAAEEAGFRYVVDVDVVRGTRYGGPSNRRGIDAVSLMVREPDFVTDVDMDLDRVPGA